MRIIISVPRKETKVSVEAEVTEQQLMVGLAKFFQFIKDKLPFKIEVDKNGGASQD